MRVRAHRPKIGVSAGFFHADFTRPIFTGKTLQYVEQSLAHWIMSSGALPVMIPSPDGETARGDVTVAHYAAWLDGLVLAGGSDVWPGSYGHEPLRPEWSGDRVRDAYEIALLGAFVDAGKPVLGICRGLQLVNVAWGGTLLQDIGTEQPGALVHRDALRYDANHHEVILEPGSRLAAWLGRERGIVNSVHHQAIRDLGGGLEVEARAATDGIIEAIRGTGPTFVAAVQWHPEFRREGDGTLDDAPLLEAFLDATTPT